MINITSSRSEFLSYVSQFKQIPYKSRPEITEWLNHHMAFLGEVSNFSRMMCVRENIMSVDDMPKCGACGEPTTFVANGYTFSKACSKECMLKIRASTHKRNLKEKYGVENISLIKGVAQKREKSLMDRYGVDNPSKSAVVKNKRKNTLLARYGTTNSFGTEEAIKKTALAFEKYGGNPSNCSSVRDKRKQTIQMNKEQDPNWQSKVNERRNNTLQRMSDTNPDKTVKQVAVELGGLTKRNSRIASNPVSRHLECPEWLDTQYTDKGRSYLSISTELGVSAQSVANRFKEFGLEPRTSFVRSSYEVDMEQYLDDLGVDYVCNDRKVIGGLELDFYIPEKTLAIEINGLHWHSTKFPDGRNRHNHKQNLCDQLGIQLIQIFEDEWVTNRPIVERRLAHLLGKTNDFRVFARKTNVSEASYSDVKGIYEQYHIQGGVGATKHYVLTHGEDVVACMSFLDKNQGNWELVRYVTTCSVLGGFSKLLKNFIRNHEVNTITSFADRRWSDGSVYETNGFDHVATTSPNYHYVINRKRIHKQNFRRSKIETKYLNGELTYFDPSLSERLNMEMNNIYQIYDAGLLKYQMTL